MTPIDWKALKPHVPLGPGDAQYVPRVGMGAREVAARIAAGDSRLLLTGPPGNGKSTELAQLPALVAATHLAVLVTPGRREDMRKLGPDRLALLLAEALARAADGEKLPLSKMLRGALLEFPYVEDVLDLEEDDWWEDAVGQPVQPSKISPSSLLRHTIEEIARKLAPRRVLFLVDDLDRSGPNAEVLFDVVRSLPDNVDVLAIPPWQWSYGGHGEGVLRADERFITLSPVDPASEEGRSFLADILRRRLAGHVLASANEPLVLDAIQKSGGEVRTFLQLMADAGTYARMRGRADLWPTDEDYRDGLLDMEDSYTRILLPGDTDAIKAIEGTDGRELDLSRKVRLLAQGILIERTRDRRTTLEVHPLARRAVFGAEHA
jgi:hypothetical protein